MYSGASKHKKRQHYVLLFSLRYAPFSVLTLLVGRQQEHPTCKKLCVCVNLLVVTMGLELCTRLCSCPECRHSGSSLHGLFWKMATTRVFCHLWVTHVTEILSSSKASVPVTTKTLLVRLSAGPASVLHRQTYLASSETVTFSRDTAFNPDDVRDTFTASVPAINHRQQNEFTIYTFIHHEGSKYMKTIRKTNNRQETTSMYMTGREIDRRKIN